MIILLRIFLIGLIIYLLVRSFVRFFSVEDQSRKSEEEKRPAPMKKISKDVGDYVDYEDVDKK